MLDEKGRAKVADTLKVPDRDVESMDMRLLAHDFSLNAPVAEDNASEWQEAMAKLRISIAEFAGDAVKSGSGGWSVFQ